MEPAGQVRIRSLVTAIRLREKGGQHWPPFFYAGVAEQHTHRSLKPAPWQGIVGANPTARTLNEIQLPRAEYFRDAFLEARRRLLRILRVADRAPDDDIICAIGERCFHVNDALLIVPVL